MSQPARRAGGHPGTPWVLAGTALGLLGLLAALVGSVPLFLDATPLPSEIWAVAAMAPVGGVLITAGTRRTAPRLPIPRRQR
jgi:hypothetical protein